MTSHTDDVAPRPPVPAPAAAVAAEAPRVRLDRWARRGVVMDVILPQDRPECRAIELTDDEVNAIRAITGTPPLPTVG